jgi:hypothetical protein
MTIARTIAAVVLLIASHATADTIGPQSTLFGPRATLDNHPPTPWGLFVRPLSDPVSRPHGTIVSIGDPGWAIYDRLAIGSTPHWLTKHDDLLTMTTRIGASLAPEWRPWTAPPACVGPPWWAPGPPPWKPTPVIPEPASAALLVAGMILCIVRPRSTR